MKDQTSTEPRVFGIGLPKTGLTSLSTLMRTIGRENTGAGKQMRRWFYIDKDYQKLLERYDSGTYFCDGPTCFMYREAFYRYGRNARFILTVRKDSQLWLDSLKRHSLYAGVKNKMRWMFGRFYPYGFDDEFKAYYDEHNSTVAKFFAEQNASELLLILRCDEPTALARLSAFLGVIFPVDQFPRENVSSPNRRGMTNFAKRHYNRIGQALYALVAPRMSVRLPEPARPVDLSGARSPTTPP
jgi:hypothetical protein